MVHYPLLLEDPYVHERNHKMLEELVTTTTTTSSSKINTTLITTSSSVRGGLGLGLMEGPPPPPPPYPTATTTMDVPSYLLPNIYKKKWKEAIKEGLSFKTVVVPEVGELLGSGRRHRGSNRR